MLSRRCSFKDAVPSALLVVLVALFLVSATPAFAESPWWQVSAGSRPTNLHPAKSEVQEINTTAGFNAGFLEVEGRFIGLLLAGETAAEVQSVLEGPYGSGNVEVSGGPVGVSGLVVKSIGALAGDEVGMITTIGEDISSMVVTEGGSGEVIVTATNLGDAAVHGSGIPVTIADKLPAGLEATAISGFTGGTGESRRGEVKCTQPAGPCAWAGPEPLPPYEQIEVRIAVKQTATVEPDEPNEVTIAGGDAPPASLKRPLTVSSAPTAFGVENYELTSENEGGSPDDQAGSHPFQLTSTIMLDQNAEPSMPPALPKDVSVKLPPGLVGNPTPFPQCTNAEFTAIENAKNRCPASTVLGVASVTAETVTIGLVTHPVPIFNLVPSVGEPARFGFEILGNPVILDTSVRTGEDYGVTVTSHNITEAAGFMDLRTTFWGVPNDPRHDQSRGWNCVGGGLWANEASCTAPASGQRLPAPFVTLPTSCTGPWVTKVEADSWAQPDVLVSTLPDEPEASLAGCNHLSFSPSISVAPDGQAGSTPTGLTVGVHVPQEVSLNPKGLAEADVKDTAVALPAGMALNPAAADGLEACSEAQAALENDSPSACPEASKVGTVEIRSPLLPNALTGAVYLAAQDANPFGSLVAMYIVAEDPVSGTLIKVAGEVRPDPVTGQLVATFDNTPQLPFEDLNLNFFGGSRAPLSTPALCGGYTTTAVIAPWSGNAAAEPSSEFKITSGPGGSACGNPLPFGPSLTAGTTSIQAGGYSPFSMTVSREDGQQNVGAIQLHMPPGLSGLLTGVELCPEAQADAGSCGPGSLIGETTVSVGLGGDPFSVTGGKVYITGPYEGAPFGLSVVVPAKAGPYNLGTVVVRGRIEVDPITSALTITTDTTGPYAIPHILDGIPLQIKHVNFITTRPGFTFNPTNCDPMVITGSISSVEGSSSPVSVPFQVTNCAVLGFKPGFSASTSGKTSRADGASLKVKLTYPKTPFGSQANIKSVKVDLPKQLPSRLTTLQKACTAAQFQANPAGCPAASMVGHAKATTPLIPVPLEGPAYFVSYGGAKFPELVVVLQGYGVTLDLHGETFISKAGITSSTFRTIPDAPVGSFELTLPQGKYSALAANGNLCASKLTIPTAFTAQNGATLKQSTPVTAAGCAKHKTKKAKVKKVKRVSERKIRGKGK
jgi:hypothetical protein